MSQHLFLFTISPVQSYIAQARKTQDLYAGSFILSHLCRTAINHAEKEGAKIIFPQRSENKSIPNRFLAVIDKENENALKAYGQKIEDIVRNEFINMADMIFRQIQIPNYKEQINNHLTIHWVCYPYNNEDNYAESYKAIEQNLGLIKNICSFNQLAEKGRKCSISGERNVKAYRKTQSESSAQRSKIPRKLYTNDVRIFEFKERNLVNLKYLEPGEGLDAVSFMKRMSVNYKSKFSTVAYNDRFPSTARIAMLDAIEQLPNKNQINLDFDKQIIFDLRAKKDKKQLEALYSNGEINNAQDILNALSKNKIKITPYYAIVLFDGDSMGQWLSGTHLADKTKLYEFHCNLSEKLADFAVEAKDCIDKKSYGKTVYAGGDDFLGLINLKYLFHAVKALRELFHQKVNTPLKAYYNNGREMTFSAGIVIVHYKTPLSIALKHARAAEKSAKEIDDAKDAVAISLLKHSGNIAATVLKWKYADLSFHTLDLAVNLAQALQECISNKFLYSLREEFYHLVDIDKDFDDYELKKIMQKELIRLLNRQKVKKAYDTTELSEQLCALLSQLVKMRNFLYFLEICNFISRETKQ